MGGNGFSVTRLKRLTEGMQGFVDRGVVTGVVTLVYRNGVEAQCDVLGFQDEEATQPMRRDTIFRIASMTKPIVSVATLMLLEEGRLRLDDPIERWLPEFADPRVLLDPAGPLDETRKAARSITVLDLLTHRPGIVSRFSALGPMIAASAGLNLPTGFALQGPDPDDWLARLGALPLVYEPGERMNYGYTTDVLGFLIARAAGMPLDRFLAARLFEPLGMTDTAFWVPAEKMPRFPVAYAINPTTGRRIRFDHPGNSRWAKPPAIPSGAGGLVSTADDYMRFARMLLTNGRLEGGRAGGERCLSRKTIELMTTDFLTPAQRKMPFLGWEMWGPRGFGLGVSIIDNPGRQAGLGSIGRYGWGGAFGTAWSNDPKENLSAIMMVQLLVGSATPAMEEDFLNLVYQAIDD
jgi:CubicO group peptidase (beta-lactamase class C family)